MASYGSVNVMPDQGLSVGAGLAQGAQNFMQAYQQGMANRNNMAMLQQQQQSENQLRQVQMQKIQQEISPTQIDIQKLSMASQLADSNPDLTKVYQGYLTKTLDNIQTPTQAAYAQSVLQQHLNNQNQNKFQQLPGPTQNGQPLMAQAPAQSQDSTDSSSGSSQPQASNEPTYAGVPYSKLSPQYQDLMNGRMTLNPYEQKVLDKMIQDRATNNIAMGRNVQSMYGANIKSMTQEDIANQMATLRDELNRRTNETKQNISDGRNATATNIAAGKNATSTVNQKIRTQNRLPQQPIQSTGPSVQATYPVKATSKQDVINLPEGAQVQWSGGGLPQGLYRKQGGQLIPVQAGQ